MNSSPNLKSNLIRSRSPHQQVPPPNQRTDSPTKFDASSNQYENTFKRVMEGQQSMDRAFDFQAFKAE